MSSVNCVVTTASSGSLVFCRMHRMCRCWQCFAHRLVIQCAGIGKKAWPGVRPEVVLPWEYAGSLLPPAATPCLQLRVACSPTTELHVALPCLQAPASPSRMVLTT